MPPSIENRPIGPASLEQPAAKSTAEAPYVIIFSPPWVRSGSARVVQNQIEYYRNRGFRTLFIGVAIHWAYWRDSPIWDAFKEGVHDLGADRVAIAALDQNKYLATKLGATFRHGLRGTALDWIIEITRSAQLPDDVIGFVR